MNGNPTTLPNLPAAIIESRRKPLAAPEIAGSIEPLLGNLHPKGDDHALSNLHIARASSASRDATRGRGTALSGSVPQDGDAAEHAEADRGGRAYRRALNLSCILDPVWEQDTPIGRAHFCEPHSREMAMEVMQ